MNLSINNSTFATRSSVMKRSLDGSIFMIRHTLYWLFLKFIFKENREINGVELIQY